MLVLSVAAKRLAGALRRTLSSGLSVIPRYFLCGLHPWSSCLGVDAMSS